MCPGSPIVGVVACLALVPLALAAGHPATGGGPVLAVAPPWGGGAVESAGGRVIGPAAAWTVLAAGATPEALRAAGIWLILAPAASEVFCGGASER